MTTLFENRSVKNKIIVTLLIACTYVLVGLLSLEAAIPPGFATVVWPAAGVALLAVLLAGPESLIGVTLGATVLHYFISLHYCDEWNIAITWPKVAAKMCHFCDARSRIVIISYSQHEHNFHKHLFLNEFLDFRIYFKLNWIL